MKKKKIKLVLVIVYIVFSAILTLALVGGVMDKIKDYSLKMDNLQISQTPQKKPALDNLVMQNYTGFNWQEVVNGEYAPCIRFRATPSEALIAEVEKNTNKTFVCICAPLQQFIDCDDGSVSPDWVSLLKAKDLRYVEFDSLTVRTDDTGNPELRVSLGTLEENYSLIMTAVFAVKTVIGEEETYEYAKFPEGCTYKTNSTSLVYQCSKELNNIAFHSGDWTRWNEEAQAKMEEVLLTALENHYEKPENAPDYYSVTLADISLTVHGKAEMTAYLEPDIPVAVYYSISEYSGATPCVYLKRDTGEIEGVSHGYVLIQAWIGGRVVGDPVRVDVSGY